MLESPLLQTIHGYLGGAWVSEESLRCVPVHNPATGSLLAHVPQMGEAETKRAIEAASRGLLVEATEEQREAWLNKIADGLLEQRAELGRIITHEHGKPWEEAKAEVDYAASFFRYYAGKVKELRPQELAARPRGLTWTVHYRPAGVVALISPWNFPLAMLAKKFSAALAAGCCAVIKPSSKTPLTMIAFFSLLERIPLPAGRANLVVGPAEEISNVFCEHPDVRVISFTGSTAIGKKLLVRTAPYIKRLSLELGGNAPFIVFSDADLDDAVAHLVANKFRGAGQTCVCTNRVLVQREVVEAFTEKLVTRTQRIVLGEGMHPGIEMGPLIDRHAFEKVREHLEDALALGARRVGEASSDAPLHDYGCFFPPTVLRGVTSGMRCIREETFGPVVPIMEFESEDEAVAEANRTEYGLAAYVFTKDEERAERVVRQLHFGHVGINTGSGPTAEAPFGGMKHSGFGREGGLEGLHEYVEPQTVPRPAGIAKNSL